MAASVVCALRSTLQREKPRRHLELDTIFGSAQSAPSRKVPMPKQHTYVLGLNTYDHDVSACLLRDGAIAFAIGKERLTREKHAGGFYKEVIDNCLEAEGITLDDVDLVVRNCYIMPVPEMEERLVYFDAPGFLTEFERGAAAKHPLFLSKSDKVVTISTIWRTPTVRSPPRHSTMAW